MPEKRFVGIGDDVKEVGGLGIQKWRVKQDWKT